MRALSQLSMEMHQMQKSQQSQMQRQAEQQKVLDKLVAQVGTVAPRTLTEVNRACNRGRWNLDVRHGRGHGDE